MPKKSPLDVLTIQLDKLTEAELLEVRSIVDALLEVKAFPEKSGSGHIEVKMIPDKKRGKFSGPYRYLRYWQDGKLRTRYLGKVESESV